MPHSRKRLKLASFLPLPSLAFFRPVRPRRTRMRNLALLAIAATGLLAAGLFADDVRKGKSGDEPFSDKMFVEKAAVGGMFEVKSSQVAQQMATDANVKNFAAHMVADHTKANQELMSLARTKGWQV